MEFNKEDDVRSLRGSEEGNQSDSDSGSTEVRLDNRNTQSGVASSSEIPNSYSKTTGPSNDLLGNNSNGSLATSECSIRGSDGIEKNSAMYNLVLSFVANLQKMIENEDGIPKLNMLAKQLNDFEFQGNKNERENFQRLQIDHNNSIKDMSIDEEQKVNNLFPNEVNSSGSNGSVQDAIITLGNQALDNKVLQMSIHDALRFQNGI